MIIMVYYLANIPQKYEIEKGKNYFLDYSLQKKKKTFLMLLSRFRKFRILKDLLKMASFLVVLDNETELRMVKVFQR